MSIVRKFRSCYLASVCIVGLSPFSALNAAPATQPTAGGQAPIAIPFSLDKPGIVTLVIEDTQGHRIRNLVADTAFPAGPNVAYWDGLDESTGVGANHGSYQIAGKLVAAGDYRVRGLVHDPIKLNYQFTAYNSGNPPWRTPDTHGGWTADHTPPQSILFLPEQKQMLIGSFVAESGDGLIWTDLNGQKLGGLRWVAGTWAAAAVLARDDGSSRLADTSAYIASGWFEGTKKKADNPGGELRLSAFQPDGKTRPILIQAGYASREAAEPTGLAVRDGVIIVAVKDAGELLLVDARTAKAKGEAAVLAKLPAKDFGGLTIDANGHLLAIVGKTICRYDIGDPRKLKSLPEPKVLVAQGLEDPQQLTTDKQGNLYVSDWGKSHQVKVFTSDGKPLRTIGNAGAPKVGAYDPDRMQHPAQIAVTDDGRLWVTEKDFLPKRISVWSLEGKLLTDFIGPPDYGAGGEIDPKDPSRFYYADWHAGAMELHLDWATGKSTVSRVYYRPEKDDLQLKTRADVRGVFGPQTPIYLTGRQYMTNLYNTTPTNFPNALGYWLFDGDRVRFVAAAGNAYRQPWLRDSAMQSRWPKGIDLAKLEDERQMNDHPVLFVWSDLNGDEKAQPDEVNCIATPAKFVSLASGDDLSFLVSTGERLRPTSINERGVPIYDLTKIERVVPENGPRGDLLDGGEGYFVQAAGPLRGFADGKDAWSYPNQWPSLHAGHAAPRQQYPGQLLATTKFIGANLQPTGAQTKPMFAYSSDRGMAYLFTADGLFVDQLFIEEKGSESRWSMTDRPRDMDVTNTAIPGENFWPRVVQNEKGIFIITGKSHSSIVKVNGLESVKPIAPIELKVTSDLLAQVGPYLAQREIERQANKASGELTVPIVKGGNKVDGKLDEWKSASWAKITEGTQAAMAVSGDRLFVAYRSTEGDFLNNQPQSLPLLFKTGGAFDLMLAGDGGNSRLIVTRADGKTHAVFYEPKVPGTPDEKRVAFASPWRTIYFDRVTDVAKDVTFSTTRYTEEVTEKKQTRKVSVTAYEFSIPLASVRLTPEAGGSVRGDIGVLRGQSGETNQRIYWHNKATSLVNDVPGEAMLQPELWGTFNFTEAKE